MSRVDEGGRKRRSRLSRQNARIPVVPLLERIIFAIAVVIWVIAIHRTGRFPSGDGPHALGTAMRLAQQLQSLDLQTFAKCFISLLGPHPPGAYVPATGAYLVAGAVPQSAHLVAGAATLYLCLDGVRRLGGGLIGALFMLTPGLVWVQAESYGIDLLAGACVVQAVSHLAASNALRHRGHTLAWGAWMAAGFMTKYTAPLFLAGPCLLAGWWVVRRVRWTALLAAFATFMALAGPWYLTRIDRLEGYILAGGDSSNTLLTNKALMQGPWWAWENANWYPASLIDAVGWPGAIAMAVGILCYKRRRDAPEGAWALPLLAVAVGWLVLSMQIQRQDRYLLPAYPLLAALTGSCLLRWLTLPVGAIGAYCTAAVFVLTTTQVPTTRNYAHHWDSAGQAWPWVHEAYMPTSLDPHRWQIDDLLARVRLYHDSDEGTVGFLLDESGGGPGYGMVLSRVGIQGYQWHVATVVLLQGPWQKRGEVRASTFVGPFIIGNWPSRRFQTLLAIIDTDEAEAQTWIDQQQLQLHETWPLSGGKEARIYTR